MSNKLRSALTALAIVGLLAPAALACLWDNDTLQMERLRFPGVLEIITGKFVRHSRAYYEWRIKNRTKKLETKPGDPALIDDLAVAYDKLGQPGQGITLLEEVLKKHPDRYETLANLGTLMFHAGKIEESKLFIEKAIEINPDAHFGRERYQLLLTTYVQQSELPTAGVMNSADRRFDNEAGFAKFVIADRFGSEEDRSRSGVPWRSEIDSATRGVLGMLHFADYQSPILLEALGDLLSVGEREENATLLAARAYLRAAQCTEDKAVAEKLRGMARGVLSMHEDFGMHHKEADGDYLPKLEKQLAQEVAAGIAWFAEIEANEKRWIAENRDVDQEFAAIYYTSLDKTIAEAEERVKSEPKEFRRTVQSRMMRSAIGTLCVLPLAIVVAVTAAVVYWMRRMRQHSSALNKPIEKAF